VGFKLNKWKKTLFAAAVFLSLSNQINTRLIKVVQTMVLDAIQLIFSKCFIKISSSVTRRCWKMWTRTICGLLSWLHYPCRVRLYFDAAKSRPWAEIVFSWL